MNNSDRDNTILVAIIGAGGVILASVLAPIISNRLERSKSKAASKVHVERQERQQPVEPMPTAAPIDTQPTSLLRVTSDPVNVRSAPAIDAEILFRLPQGSLVTVTNKATVTEGMEWAPIQSDLGGTGWVIASFLRRESSV